MKNIKKALSLFWKLWMYFSTAVVTFLCSLFLAYTVFLWVISDFSPDFLSMNSCLDAGGRWDYEARACEYAADP